MAHKRDMDFPTEWVMCDADDNKRDDDVRHSDDCAKDPAKYRAETATPHSDKSASQAAPARADLLEVKGAAAYRKPVE